MPLASGALSLTSAGSTSIVVTTAAATGGTSPYSYQLYRSTTSGFSTGPSNIITGATSLVYTDTGLIPGTQYYYKSVVTDDASPAANATSSQLAAATGQPLLSQNQFQLAPFLGQVDMPYNYNTHPVILDATLASATVTSAYPGQAVKLVAYNNGTANAGSGPLHVIPCVSDSDACCGFLNWNLKNISFVAGNAAEMSMSGNIIYLYATGAITQGAAVYLDITTIGGVSASGSVQVGIAYDGASAGGALIRVYVKSDVF